MRPFLERVAEFLMVADKVMKWASVDFVSDNYVGSNWSWLGRELYIRGLAHALLYHDFVFNNSERSHVRDFPGSVGW